MYNIKAQNNFQSLIPLNQIKNFLKIDNNDEDEYISSCLKVAENSLYKYTLFVASQRNFIIQTDQVAQNDKILIKLSPIISCQGITLTNQQDQKTQINNYTIKHSYLKLQNDAQIDGEVEINITCGHQSYEEIDPELVNAIKHHAAFLYENRGVEEKLPNLVFNTYRYYKKFNITF